MVGIVLFHKSDIVYFVWGIVTNFGDIYEGKKLDYVEEV